MSGDGLSSSLIRGKCIETDMSVYLHFGKQSPLIRGECIETGHVPDGVVPGSLSPLIRGECIETDRKTPIVSKDASPPHTRGVYRNGIFLFKHVYHVSPHTRGVYRNWAFDAQTIMPRLPSYRGECIEIKCASSFSDCSNLPSYEGSV